MRKEDNINSHSIRGTMSSNRSTAVILTVFLTAIVLNNIYIIIFHTFHGDELYFLSIIYDFERKEPQSLFQTFYVHLYEWLLRVHGSEAMQIVLGRATMGLATFFNLLLVYGLGRRFLSPTGAIFAAFSYATFTYVIEHGTSFRIDPLASFLVLASALLLTGPTLTMVRVALAGLILALATALTIKVVLFVAVFLVLPLALSPTLTARVRSLGVLLSAYGVSGIALLAFHARSVCVGGSTPAVVDGNDSAIERLQDIGAKVLIEEGLVPRYHELLRSFAENPTFYLLMLLGLYGILKGDYNNIITNRQRITILILFIPFLFILFYRNAFEYFYVMLVPLASFLTALEWSHLRSGPVWPGKGDKIRKGILFACIAIPMVFAIAGQYSMMRRDNEAQLALIAGVHQIFPEPVPYIDGYSAIASFPSTGFLMSSWGVDRRRSGEIESMRSMIAREEPPLLIVNSPSLIGAMDPTIEMPPEYDLPDDDATALRESYLPYWGMVHVAGKHLVMPSSQRSLSFEVLVGGDYRVESATSIVLNGSVVHPSEVIRVPKGVHELRVALDESPTGTVEVMLRWADLGAPPTEAPPDFLSFFALRK